MFEQDQLSSGLTVHRAGVQSSMQDLGRFGYAQQGLSQGGAMDLHAHCWANRLLENTTSSPTLEIVIGLAEFRAESNLLLSISGADMQAQVDGSPVGNGCAFSMKRGQILTLKAARDGMRAYLAVSGGIQVPPILGSVSTVMRNHLGSLLKEGDFLPAATSDFTEASYMPRRFVPTYPDAIELRVIESYQVSEFDPAEIQRFYQSEYTLTQDSDRMGARLSGNPIRPPAAGLISEGIAHGAIQIPADGQPIILLNDRQTLGGYPKLGCIAKVDLPKLAQARPGTRICFVPVNLEKAREQWQEFCCYFRNEV